jgi:hypothetical protein
MFTDYCDRLKLTSFPGGSDCTRERCHWIRFKVNTSASALAVDINKLVEMVGLNDMFGSDKYY